jgi:hypothetical protein
VRKDEEGNKCPSTLGEYLVLCHAIGGEKCKAVAWLREKIAASPHGQDEVVQAPDSQMRMLLMPMLVPGDGL